MLKKQKPVDSWVKGVHLENINRQTYHTTHNTGIRPQSMLFRKGGFPDRLTTENGPSIYLVLLGIVGRLLVVVSHGSDTSFG